MEGTLIFSKPHFKSFMQSSTNIFEIDSQIDTTFNKILLSAHEYHREGSNWTFDKILGFDICIATYKPLHASTFIKLPKYLKDKKAIINIKNTDNKCFLYCVIAGLDTRVHSHPNRVSNYLNMIHLFNLEGITFPVTINQIAKFEKNNNVSINVLGYENEIFPIFITQTRGVPHINLILIEREGVQLFNYKYVSFTWRQN